MNVVFFLIFILQQNDCMPSPPSFTALLSQQVLVVAVTNLTCHAECRGRCFGEGAGECCDAECAGGCHRPGNTRCWVSNSLRSEYTVSVLIFSLFVRKRTAWSLKARPAHIFAFIFETL